MKNKLMLFSGVVMVLEIAIFFWVDYISTADYLVYQLAARYSGRLSFMIFAGMMLFTGIVGLKQIFKTERLKSFFIILLSLFSVNHVLHFYFLAMSHLEQNETLLIPKNIIGGTAYILLILSPFYLFKREMTTKIYWSVQSFLFLLTVIFFVSYLRRFMIEFPQPTHIGVLYSIITTIGLLVFLNGYKVFKESTESRSK
jgi:hypothetical protein